MSSLSRINRRAMLAGLAAMPWLGPLHAAEGTGKPIRIVVPTPAGGPSDTVARLVAQALPARLGQPVIVDNKPGAGGALAAQEVMRSAPDGLTLLWGQASLAGLPLVQKGVPYNDLSELAPVGSVVQFGYAVFAAKDLPVNSFKELVAYGRAHPDKLSVATGTLGEAMFATQVLQSAGVRAVRVPYKGGAQLMPDLISGLVQLNFGPIASGLPHVKSGRIRMLATMLPRRSPLAPDVPTLTELGYDTRHLPSWNALFAPAGTPADRLARVSSAVAEVLKQPSVEAALAQHGALPLASTPAELAQTVRTATATWKTFVREYDIAQE